MRNSALLLAGLWLAAACGSAAAQGRDLPEILLRGEIRVALYNGLPPFSDAGRGIDVDLAQALARKLGVALAPLWFDADEDMTDDLRNMVWRGHYLGAGPADVMMHAPVDQDYAGANRRVRFVAPYFVERFEIARDTRRVPRLDSLVVFASEAIAVASDTWPDSMMLAADGGRYRHNVVHFRTASDAVAALREARVSAAFARRSELEAGLNGVPHVEIAAAPLPGGRREWTVGLAVKADHAALAGALEQAMSQLEAEGALARIFAQHGVRRVPPGARGSRRQQARAHRHDGEGEKADLSQAERNELAKLVQVLKGYAREGRSARRLKVSGKACGRTSHISAGVRAHDLHHRFQSLHDSPVLPAWRAW